MGSDDRDKINYLFICKKELKQFRVLSYYVIKRKDFTQVIAILRA